MNIKTIVINIVLVLTLLSTLKSIRIHSTDEIQLSQYLGCYTDTTTRDFKVRKNDVSKLIDCQVQCNGYNYFAIQNGASCFCGNAYATASTYYKTDDAICQKKNLGRELYWGFNFHNAVYKNINYQAPIIVPVVTSTPIAIDPTQFVGCYRDDTTRDFKVRKNDVGRIFECQVQCAGYTYYAVQNGAACFCGNAYATADQYSKIDNALCKEKNLNRELDLYWGGNFKNAVYFTIAPSAKVNAPTSSATSCQAGYYYNNSANNCSICSLGSYSLASASNWYDD